MALEQLTNLVAEASANADAILAKASSDSAALAQAQSDIANMEANAVAVVQPLADKLSAANPPLRNHVRDCQPRRQALGQQRWQAVIACSAECLEAAIAKIDKGEIAPEHIVIAYGTVGETSNNTGYMPAGSFNSYAQQGLLSSVSRPDARVE